MVRCLEGIIDIPILVCSHPGRIGVCLLPDGAPSLTGWAPIVAGDKGPPSGPAKALDCVRLSPGLHSSVELDTLMHTRPHAARLGAEEKPHLRLHDPGFPL